MALPDACGSAGINKPNPQANETKRMNNNLKPFRHMRTIGALVLCAICGLGAGSYYCPWGELDEGPCGRWSLYSPPGYCYQGECLHNLRCRWIGSGNGPYLYCTERSVDCVAILDKYGPDLNGNPCKIYLGKDTVECSQPSATRIAATIACPE